MQRHFSPGEVRNKKLKKPGAQSGNKQLWGAGEEPMNLTMSWFCPFLVFKEYRTQGFFL